MSAKHELIITALQQRIGEIVSNYETQIAILRAEITQIVDQQKQKEQDVKNYENELAEKIANI